MIGEDRKPHLAIIPGLFGCVVESSDEVFFLFIGELWRSPRSGIVVRRLLDWLLLEPIEPSANRLLVHIVQLAIPVVDAPRLRPIAANTR